MEEIRAGGDNYSGVSHTRFVGRDGPTPITQWRPNRFVVRATGYHDVLRYRSDAAEPGGDAGSEPPHYDATRS